MSAAPEGSLQEDVKTQEAPTMRDLIIKFTLELTRIGETVSGLKLASIDEAAKLSKLQMYATMRGQVEGIDTCLRYIEHWLENTGTRKSHYVEILSTFRQTKGALEQKILMIAEGEGKN